MNVGLLKDQCKNCDALISLQITENLDCVFWAAPPDLSKMTYVSKSYEKIWGKTCSSLYEEPKSFLDPIHKDDIKTIRKKIKEMSQNGTFDGQYRIIKPDGEVRWVWDRGFPLKNEKGDTYQSVGVVVDITEFKRLEETTMSLAREYRSHFRQQKNDILKKESTIREVFNLYDSKREEFEEVIKLNLTKLVFPILSDLIKTGSPNIKIYQLLENNLKNIFSGFGIKTKDLSATESVVCSLIKNGFRSKEVASRLGISIKTVNNHRANIRNKLGLKNSGENLTAYLQKL